MHAITSLFLHPLSTCPFVQVIGLAKRVSRRSGAPGKGHKARNWESQAADVITRSARNVGHRIGRVGWPPKNNEEPTPVPFPIKRGLQNTTLIHVSPLQFPGLRHFFLLSSSSLDLWLPW